MAARRIRTKVGLSYASGSLFLTKGGWKPSSWGGGSEERDGNEILQNYKNLKNNKKNLENYLKTRAPPV